MGDMMESEDPFQSYLGRAQVGLLEFGGPDLDSSVLDGDFCTPHNLASSVQYINNTLDAFGFPPALPPPIESASPDPKMPPLTVDMTVQLVNTLYSVLQRYQKDVDFRSETSDRIRRLQADKDLVTNTSKRWEDRAKSIERELSTVTAKARSNEEAARRAKDKWDLEKEEATRQISSLQHKDSQAQHEIRKKEREYNRLQERLQHMLNERNREVKAGMGIRVLSKGEGKKRAGWKMQGGKNVEDEMYKMIITTYENKQQELVQETNDLRNSLRDLQGELQQLLNDHQPNKRTHTDASATPTRKRPSPVSSPMRNVSTTGAEPLTTEFDLPYSLARETIEERIRAQMQRYRDIVNAKSQHAEIQDPETLQVQLDECKKIIEDQEQLVCHLLKFSSNPSTAPLPISPPSASTSLDLVPPSPTSPTSVSQPHVSPPVSPISASSHPATDNVSPPRVMFPVYPNTPGRYRGMDDSRVELDERLLAEERKLFEEQKRNFEEERKKVEDMALELAKERLELQELKEQLTGKPYKTREPIFDDNGLSESFLHELEQASLSNEVKAPPSPITFKHQ